MESSDFYKYQIELMLIDKHFYNAFVVSEQDFG